mmetsp:Transcript_18066/g.54582  ORF Transcript_18066/g.54582 Transcript_18066/m.54582 type:complete len:209 (-) Transcript_18066:525-1151(-)
MSRSCTSRSSTALERASPGSRSGAGLCRCGCPFPAPGSVRAGGGAARRGACPLADACSRGALRLRSAAAVRSTTSRSMSAPARKTREPTVGRVRGGFERAAAWRAAAGEQRERGAPATKRRTALMRTGGPPASRMRGKKSTDPTMKARLPAHGGRCDPGGVTPCLRPGAGRGEAGRGCRRRRSRTRGGWLPRRTSRCGWRRSAASRRR